MPSLKAAVAVTDEGWFEHFRPRDWRTKEDEVNFWRPMSQQRFGALEPGGPFFFRLGAPVRAIVGFGFFAATTAMSIETAWEVFGEKVGAPDLPSFAERLSSMRRRLGGTPGHATRLLSCLILRDAVFLPSNEWISWGRAEGWSDRQVRYQGYDLTTAPGDRLAELLRVSGGPTPPDLVGSFAPAFADARTFREGRHVKREAQGTFRVRLLQAYGNQCAVTREHALPVLDAAHITPYLGAHSNHIQNGLVLRADLHRLYDDGYITVTPDLRLEVSRRLKDEFENGKVYYEMAGREVAVPSRPELRPSAAALEWHAETVFR